ncbi:hypothetical protein GCK32_020005 [Trichostrongylus colubriformis]|uniref:Uncharacterized protein n=1 Tax=Trichostrongylus colubriformis TaxID=6319 RepID=A0AAN8IHD9_TRICO
MKLFYFFSIVLIMGLHNEMAHAWQSVIVPVIRSQVRNAMGVMAAGEQAVRKMLSEVEKGGPLILSSSSVRYDA